MNEPDAWLYGYWFWDWADSYEKIERIDLARREISLAKPWSGYRKNQRYHAVNLLAELDLPGEWYLDRGSRRVFLFPKVDPGLSVVELSVAPFPLLDLDGASHLRFQGLLWESGAADGVRIAGGEDCRLQGCTIRKMAGTGVEVRGGRRHELRSSEIHTLGRGGVALAGGDRKTLSPGEHRVENCHIHHVSRIDHTYTPGVWVDGVGQVLRHNLIHHVASSAMRVEGNDHLVEFNEVHNVVEESGDAGAYYVGRDWTQRGNVLRVDQFVIHCGDRVLPQQRLFRNERAEITHDRAHVAVRQLEPRPGKRVGELIRILVEAPRDLFVGRVEPQGEVGGQHGWRVTL